MFKIMPNQKIVLFIEQADAEFEKPSKIGNFFINRFAIDEDVENEILKIYHIEKKLRDFSRGWLTLEEGLDLLNHTIACDSLGWTYSVRSVKRNEIP